MLAGPSATDRNWESRPQVGSVLPVLADVKAPLPGQVVKPVIISEEGPDHVEATCQCAPWCFLHCRHKFILVGPGAIAAHHEDGLVHCGKEVH